MTRSSLLLLLLLLLGGSTAGGPVATAQTPARDTAAASVAALAPFQRELTGAQRPDIPSLAAYRSFESERGWVFANDTVRAREIITAVRWAAARFERLFGQPVPRGMVLLHNGNSDPNVPRESLNFGDFGGADVGWTFTLYVTPGEVGFAGVTDSAALFATRPTWEASTRATIRQRQPAIADARLTDTLAKLWADRVAYMLHDDTELLTHEIAHGWFDKLYRWNEVPWNPAWTWPRPNDWAGLPQWLVEMGGILLNGENTYKERREGLIEAYRRTEGATVVPLDTLFASPNPINGPHGISSGQWDPNYMWVFYCQIQGVIDFLLERGRDSTVFRSITASYASGHDMAEWLRAEGSRYHLPPTMEALEKEWRQWLTRMVKQP